MASTHSPTKRSPLWYCFMTSIYGLNLSKCATEFKGECAQKRCNFFGQNFPKVSKNGKLDVLFVLQKTGSLECSGSAHFAQIIENPPFPFRENSRSAPEIYLFFSSSAASRKFPLSGINSTLDTNM